MKPRTLILPVIGIGLCTTNKVAKDINDYCKTLYENFERIKNSCVLFDEKFEFATYNINRSDFINLREYFYERAYEFIEKCKKIILSIQHKNKKIKDKIVVKMRGNKGNRFINVYLNDIWNLAIQYNYFVSAIEQSIVHGFPYITDVKDSLKSLEKTLKDFREYLYDIKSKEIN